MTIYSIIKLKKYEEEVNFDSIQNFVALDIGTGQEKVKQRAEEAFISTIESEVDEDISYRVGKTYIEAEEYENDQVIIYFKTSEDAS